MRTQSQQGPLLKLSFFLEPALALNVAGSADPLSVMVLGGLERFISEGQEQSRWGSRGGGGMGGRILRWEFPWHAANRLIRANRQVLPPSIEGPGSDLLGFLRTGTRSV